MSDLMDRIGPLLHRLYFETPWCWLSWPAAAMVIGTVVALCSDRAAKALAVVPRQASGIVGIFTAPFVHANAAHLAANLPPFLALGTLVVRRAGQQFVEIAVTIALAQGILLWTLGRRAAHLGMSGVIFGFFGYLIALGWFTRTMPDLLVAGGVLLFYGSMLAGIAPARAGTSWEGHLFGLIEGFARAWMDASGFKL
jgi:membrane associated rhomboid family serine protease